MAIQGPASSDTLRAMGLDGVEHLKPFEVKAWPLGGGELLVARMGFTADLGYECWMKSSDSSAFEQKLMEARKVTGLDIPGYGLTALQACRLEGGFIVAGWDCATEVEPVPGFERTPFELGIGWIVKLDGNEFVGRDALLKQKAEGQPHTFRYGSINEEFQPEDGAALFDESGKQVGIITSSKVSIK